MPLQIAVLSRQGGRDENEDACGYWTSETFGCWVLSDGAGGHGGGDTASKLVVSTIVHDFANAPTLLPAAIVDALQRANRMILSHQNDQPRLQDMRATAVVLLIDQSTRSALWGHVGDSRLYCFRAARRLLQTRDHSVIQGIVDSGMVDAQMLRTHPHRNLLLQALGSGDAFLPSVTDTAFALLESDVFLLCSDGFWEYVDEACMENALAAAASPQAWLAALECEVLRQARAGHDNYSAIAVWVANGSPQAGRGGDL